MKNETKKKPRFEYKSKLQFITDRLFLTRKFWLSNFDDKRNAGETLQSERGAKNDNSGYAPGGFGFSADN